MRSVIAISLISLALSFADTGHCAERASCVGPALSKATYGVTESELASAGSTLNLLELRFKAPAEAKKLNEEVLAALRSEPAPVTARKAVFSESEITDLFRAVKENRQVSASLCGTYRGSGQMGLCWGRAMAAHLKALQAGSSNDSVRKVWAVGSLTTGRDRWKYHVTTIVRGSEGTWYAIDPIFPGPLRIDDWVYKMKEEFDPTNTMRIFATPAERFGPDTPARYSKAELTEEAWHGFFIDLLDTIYRENTGKPGPWTKIKNKADRSMFLKRLLLSLGIGGLSAKMTDTFYNAITEAQTNAKP